MDYLHNHREQFAEAISLALFQTGLAPKIVDSNEAIQALGQIAESGLFD